MSSDARTGFTRLARIGLALVTLLAGSYPLAGNAREAEVRGSFRTVDLYNTELGATVLDGRLDTEIEFGPFILGGAWRGYHLSDKTYNPRGIEYPQPRIKHRYAEARAESLLAGGSLLLRAGDFFATYDRGLTLSSFEEADLERDTALDGILGEYDLGGVKLSALSGKATERVSATRSNEHEATGGRAVYVREGLFSLAASGLKRRVERHDEGVALPESLRKFDDEIFGGQAELWYGPLHLAGDYARRQGDYYPTLKQGSVAGHGGYLTGTLSVPYLTVVGEYKDYRRFANALVNPPTCVMEHTSTLMNRVTHEVDLDDERGFLVQGDLAVVEGVPLTAGASEARRDNGDLANWEIFGLTGLPAGRLGRVSVEASWSREYTLGKFAEHLTVMLETQLAGGDLEVPVEFGLGGQAIEEPSGETYENYLATGTWYAAPAVVVSGVIETTTQEGLDRDVWLFGELGVALAQGLDASVGFGTERGGKKCSGGVCYTEPEFTGLRLRLIKYF